MTQEEKDIIYKDACYRLPYHPYAAYTLDDGTTVQVQLTGADDGQYYGYNLDTWGHIPDYDVKLYLRPMSSMTEEEKETLRTLKWTKLEHYVVDWLNQHYLDYRNLISKGLALIAPEEMYEKKINT